MTPREASEGGLERPKSMEPSGNAEVSEYDKVSDYMPKPTVESGKDSGP
jgi:hypothetical protein